MTMRRRAWLTWGTTLPPEHEEIMTDPGTTAPDQTPPTETPASTRSLPRQTALRGPGPLVVVLMLVLLSAFSGIVGAFTVLHFRPVPAVPHIAVLDTTKIAEAVAEAAKRDEGIVQRFPQRFDQIILQLQDADPDRVILVREAVVGSEVDDLTPAVLHEIRGESPAASRRPNAH